MVSFWAEIVIRAGELLVAALAGSIVTTSETVCGHITQCTIDTTSAGTDTTYQPPCVPLQLYHLASIWRRDRTGVATAIVRAVGIGMGPARNRWNRAETEVFRAAGPSSELEQVRARGLTHVVIFCLLTGGDGGVGKHSSDSNPPFLHRCRRLGFFSCVIWGCGNIETSVIVFF
jgi:hypothetical protein